LTSATWGRFDVGQLSQRIDALGEIGALPTGGLFRGLYDDAWAAAVDQVEEWMRQDGLVTRRDAVGNLYGRVEGRESGPCVVSGSHIDTVRSGGKYDGALGIHAAMAAVNALVADHGKPRRTIEVLATAEEEGSRFACNFFAARAIVGQVGADEPERIADPQGVTIAQAMRQRGLDPSRISEARRDDIAAFVELHIEQGAILEAEGIPLGVVDTITGQRVWHVRLTGRQDHAGTTPMDMRADALAGAMEIAGRAREKAIAMGRPSVATVGRIAVQPHQTNVVPGVCDFTIDARHSDTVRRRELVDYIESTMKRVAAERGLGLESRVVQEHDPVPMHPLVCAAIEESIAEMGVRSLVMPSGAGHDSEIMASRFPAGMIFVPSRDGRSHSPDEFTPIEQIVPGVEALARTLFRLAY
jgi:allantoate deiminase